MIQFIRENTWIVPIIVAIITALSRIIVDIINKTKANNGRKQKVGKIKTVQSLILMGIFQHVKVVNKR